MSTFIENIPEGWRQIVLGEVLKYEQPYKYTVDSTHYSDKSGIPVLTAGKSFILGYTNETNNVYLNHPVIIFDDFTTDSKFVDFPFKVKSSAMKFLKERRDNEIDLKFIFEVLQTVKLPSTGGDHKRRWISEYSRIKVKAPQYKEQTRIAQILSKVDAAVERTEALIAKYQRIKSGLMQDLLTKGIDKHGNIRSKATHTFIVKNGIEVPEEWKVEEFGKYIIKIDSGWSPICESRPASPGEWGSLKTTAITWEGYNPNENKRLPEELKPLPEIEVKLDDILITRVGPRDRVGVVVHVDDEREKLMLSDNMLRLKMKPKNDIYLPFLPIMLGSKVVQKVWKSQIAGLAEAQVVINQQAINSVLIPLPSPNEQRKIFERYSILRRYLDEQKSNLKKLLSVKVGLMQDLLSGKVRIKMSEPLVNQMEITKE